MFFLSGTMKFFIYFVLAFATVWAKDVYFRSIEDPVLKNEGRITHGHVAAAQHFKYQVGLSVTVESSTFWCGASLISKEWVLSSAHCVVSASSVEVYLGATQRLASEKNHTVGRGNIYVYPRWSPGILKNDISLIEIPETNVSSRIGIVKIPTINNNTYLGDRVFITGWGQTSDNDTGLSNDLRYGILEVSPGNICFEKYGRYYSDDVRLCVATPNRVSTCHGDSGGPLVLEAENLQIGVSSFGDSEGCTRRSPLVFTRVSAYYRWIKSLTGITD